MDQVGYQLKSSKQSGYHLKKNPKTNNSGGIIFAAGAVDAVVVVLNAFDEKGSVIPLLSPLAAKRPKAPSNVGAYDNLYG